MAESNPIELSVDGPIITATLQRPEKKNALTEAMYETLVDAFDRLDAEPHRRVLVIRASGELFSAGNDIGDFLNRHTETNAGPRPVHRFLDRLATARKPIVAAVNGPAIGIGLTMLLHHDLVFASETATFCAPFASLGLVPEAGSSQLLPQRVGYPLAMEMFLLGRRLSANEALTHGLINAIVPAATLWEHAHDAAQRIAALPPTAVQTTKSLCRQSESTLPERIAQEIELFTERLQSDEAREALQAFLEKRTANFSPDRSGAQ